LVNLEGILNKPALYDGIKVVSEFAIWIPTVEHCPNELEESKNKFHTFLFCGG
jgi:hypothetical protein